MRITLLLHSLYIFSFYHCRSVGVDRENTSLDKDKNVEPNDMHFSELYFPRSTIKTAESPPDTFLTLDLLHPDEKRISVHDKEIGEILRRNYYVKDGLGITSITISGVELWKANRGSCIFVESFSGNTNSLFSLCLHFDGKVDYKNFAKVGESWQEVDQDLLSQMYQSMKNGGILHGSKTENQIFADGKPDFSDTEASLELSQREPKHQFIHSSGVPSPKVLDLCYPAFGITFPLNINGIHSKIFVMDHDDPVQTLLYDGTPVWNGSPNDKCIFCIVLFKAEDPKMVLIKAEDENSSSYTTFMEHKERGDLLSSCSCFRKNMPVLCCLSRCATPKGWHRSKNDYIKNINKLRMNQDAVTRFTLDLSSADNCLSYSFSKNNVENRFLAPKSGNMSRITDGDEIIWEECDQVCFFCEVYSRDNYKILRLHVKKEEAFSFPSFEKVDQGWERVSSERFSVRVRNMDEKNWLVPLFLPTPSGPTPLQISPPDGLLCELFDYVFNYNPAKLIVPNKHVKVSNLAKGKNSIWTAGCEETFGYAKVYPGKYQSEFVLVVATTPTGVSNKYYECDKGTCKLFEGMIHLMARRVVPSDFLSHFTIDLASDESMRECTIFEANIIGITTRHFYPKPGYIAIAVKDGLKSVWSTNNYPNKFMDSFGSANKLQDSECVSCVIYKKGGLEMLRLSIKFACVLCDKYYRNVDGKWVAKNECVFDKYFPEMKNVLT